MCRGCGRQRLSECTCGLADKMRKELAGLVAQGKNREQVYQYFIDAVGQPGAARPARSTRASTVSRGRSRTPSACWASAPRPRSRSAGRAPPSRPWPPRRPPPRSIPPSSSASPMSSATSTDAAERHDRRGPAAGAGGRQRATLALLRRRLAGGGDAGRHRVGAHGARAPRDAQRHGVRRRRERAGRLPRHRAARRRAPTAPRRGRRDARGAARREGARPAHDQGARVRSGDGEDVRGRLHRDVRTPAGARAARDAAARRRRRSDDDVASPRRRARRG